MVGNFVILQVLKEFKGDEDFARLMNKLRSFYESYESVYFR